jgi:hypothetical protein
MHRYFTAVCAVGLVLAVVLAVTSIPSAAANSRYCLQGRAWGYPGNCQFATFEQCQASASGTDASCGINPHHAYARHHRSSHPRQ